MSDHTKTLNTIADRIDNALQARDAAIIAAHNDGMKVLHIANAVRLSRAQVHRIIKADNDRA